MGIMDNIMGLVGKDAAGALGGAGGGQMAGIVTSLIGEGGKNLPALLEQFHAGGLGHLAESWVGKGANLPVSGGQVKSVLGSDAISGIAAQLGVSEDEAASKVATVLPEVVDKVTPDGVVPDAQALSQNVGGLLKP